MEGRHNVSKSTEIIFALCLRLVVVPRPVTLFGEPIEWIEATRYLEVTLDKQLHGRLTSIRIGRKPLKKWSCWVLF